MEPAKKQAYRLPSNGVWFITGCSSGIGKSLAQIALSKGQRVVATARKLADLAYLPDESGTVLKLSVDVTSGESIDEAVATALAMFGRIDVVVNNAGYSLRGDTENATDEAARHLVETVLWGTVRLTRHAMRIMREVNPQSGPRGGVVLNVSSMGGRVAVAGNAFYHAAKFAVEGFTESVSKEVRPEWNIHFCLAEPGGVKTGFLKRGTIAIEPHPAYAAPDSPSRVLDSYLQQPDVEESWADAGDVANAMYAIVASRKEIPLRLPLGPDAYGVLRWENEKNGKALEEWKEISLSVGKEGQFEAVEFLLRK